MKVISLPALHVMQQEDATFQSQLLSNADDAVVTIRHRVQR